MYSIQYSFTWITDNKKNAEPVVLVVAMAAWAGWARGKFSLQEDARYIKSPADVGRTLPRTGSSINDYNRLEPHPLHARAARDYFPYTKWNEMTIKNKHLSSFFFFITIRSHE